MKDLIIDLINIPTTPEEDHNIRKTTWINNRLVELKEGIHTIYYIGHQDSFQISENGSEIITTQAFPIRVKNPITDEKILNTAIKRAYRLNTDEDVSIFQTELLSLYQTNPNSAKLVEYNEFVKWVKNELIIAKGISLGDAKRIVKDKIEQYDKSEFINVFYINGSKGWLDKNTRVGLLNSINIEKLNGYSKTNIWLGTEYFSLPIDTAINFLMELELYAKQCYNTTAEHLRNIEQLEEIEKILNYDFTLNYPNVINIKV